MMDSFTPKLDWFRHRFLSNDNSYLFSWSRRLNQKTVFFLQRRLRLVDRVLGPVFCLAFRPIGFVELSAFGESCRSIRDCSRLMFQPLLEYHLGFQQSKSGPETPN